MESVKIIIGPNSQTTGNNINFFANDHVITSNSEISNAFNDFCA